MLLLQFQAFKDPVRIDFADIERLQALASSGLVGSQFFGDFWAEALHDGFKSWACVGF